MKNGIIAYLALFFCIDAEITHQSDIGSSASNDESSSSAFRYILYDVNPHEGFNLRRDVYIRLAVLAHRLANNSVKWRLVLPPWNYLPHWRSKLAGNQHRLPWGLFFDLNSMLSFAPVIEAYEFFEDHPNTPLDHIIILQNFLDLWTENFTWTDKWAIEKCHRPLTYTRDEAGMYNGSTLGFPNTVAKEVHCVSFQGPASLLIDLVEAFDGRFILIEQAQIVLHDHYGSADYWKCRKSMKFSDDLIKLALDFKETALDSNFEEMAENSTNSTYFEGDPYLCIHLRRQDYVHSRPMQVPTIRHAAYQIKTKLSELNLSSVFVATDTNEEEFEELSRQLLPFRSVRYQPSLAILRKYKDGGVAIIEQIICSHARYFVGSFESTFSFRIQEERELLNMDPETTFNRLCGNSEGSNCSQPTRWRMVS